MYIAVRQTCCLITKNRSIARSLIIPKKWSIARSLITEIEVINRSLNSITFRSQHFENFSLFLYYCPSKLECLKNPGNCSELFFRCFCGTNGPTAAAFLVKFKKKTSISKLRSDNKVLFAVKIKPAVIKTRSHAAEDDQCTIIFPTLIRKKYICSTFIKIKKISKRKLHEDFFYCGEPF